MTIVRPSRGPGPPAPPARWRPGAWSPAARRRGRCGWAGRGRCRPGRHLRLGDRDALDAVTGEAHDLGHRRADVGQRAQGAVAELVAAGAGGQHLAHQRHLSNVSSVREMPTVTVLAWCLMASTGRVSSSMATVSAAVRSSMTTAGVPTLPCRRSGRRRAGPSRAGSGAAPPGAPRSTPPAGRRSCPPAGRRSSAGEQGLDHRGQPPHSTDLPPRRARPDSGGDRLDRGPGLAQGRARPSMASAAS